MWDIFQENYINSKGVDVVACTSSFSEADSYDSHIYRSGNWNLMPYFVLHALTIPKLSLGEPLEKDRIRPGSCWTKLGNYRMRKQKYEEILEVGMKILRPNRDGLYFAIATYITFQSAKGVLLNKLNTIQSIGSFLRTKNGYKVTNPEGYVAIQKGGAVKLVDRLEFSRANFNMAKDWVKG